MKSPITNKLRKGTAQRLFAECLKDSPVMPDANLANAMQQVYKPSTFHPIYRGGSDKIHKSQQLITSVRSPAP